MGEKNTMGYGKISSTKKGISLVASMLIHLVMMVVLGLSVQDPRQKSLSKRFDLYAIKLLDLKPMSKDRLTSKGDKKSAKMVRKKKSNKKFSQKGVRQALAPKTPLESLKKTASDPLREAQNTPSPKFTPQHRPLNKLDKASAMANLDPVRRQPEREQKLAFNRPKVLTKLEKSSSLKRYTQQLKAVNKKQITPLKSTSNQHVKLQPQQLVDQLRRTQRLSLPNRSSQVRMKLAQQQALPQGERKIQLAKLTPNQPQDRINDRINYQQKQLNPKPVVITQRQVSYNTRSAPVIRKTAIGPNQFLTEITQTITEVKQVETITQVVKMTTSVSRADSTPMLKNELVLESVPTRVVKRQAQLATTTPQKTQALRRVSYQQQQSQWKPVELTQQRVSYQRQSQMVNREVSGPTTLDVATPIQLEMVQPQNLETLNRQRVSVEHTPKINEAILNPKGILEEVSQKEFTDKQVQLVRLKSSTEEFVVKKRLKFEQRSTVAEPTRIIQQRVAYQQVSQEVDKKSLEQPTNLMDTVAQLKEPAESLTSKTHLATISRQDLTPSVSTLPDNFVLETQRYASQERPALDYTKARNRVDLSSQTVEQKERLAFAYAPQAKGKSKAKLDANPSSGGVSASQMPSSPSSSLLSRGQATTGEKDAPVIKANLPSGNTTNETLYRLRGEVEGDVKQAFITINEVTQLVQVINGEFEVEIAMVKGINKISILAFDSRGGMGKETVEVLYTPLPGIPFVKLKSPENGKQGLREGDPVIVLGTIDDHSVTRATLYLNGVPIQMKVVNGHFKKKVFLPSSRITTFRVMAQSNNGPPGYSSLHTILAGYDIDIINPRPY